MSEEYSETIVTEAGTKVRTVCVVDKVQAIWGQADQGLARDVCLTCGDVKAGNSSGQQAAVFVSHHTAACCCSEEP